MLSYFIRVVKRLLRHLGYELRPIPDDPSLLTIKDKHYYTQWTMPYRLFTPWEGHPDFQKFYEGVARHTIVPPDHCYYLISFGRYAVHLQGDFAECGVYRGGTALLLCRVLGDAHKRLFLFDSFQGLPARHPEKDKSFWGEGMFHDTSLELVHGVLKDFRHLVDIRKGWIPNTFVGLDHNRYAFVHVDVDLYQSCFDCCEYFYPRLVAGGVMLFDEYGFPSARGEKDAVDDFFRDKRDSPITLPTGQAIVVKAP